MKNNEEVDFAKVYAELEPQFRALDLQQILTPNESSPNAPEVLPAHQRRVIFAVILATTATASVVWMSLFYAFT